MTIRTILAFIAAVGCGLTAVFFMNSAGSSNEPPPQKVAVVSATRDLLNFDVVQPEFIGPKEIHISDFQSGVHIPWPTSENKSQEQFDQELKELYNRICERTVVFSMAKGDVVTDQKLASKNAGQGLAALIPSGMRAVFDRYCESRLECCGVCSAAESSGYSRG